MNLSVPSLRFTRAEILFSLKSFAAAMLAMVIASRAGLPRPFWALLTSYVVAAPMAGNVRSKALYRFCGTLIGCTATVLIVPALANAPSCSRWGSRCGWAAACTCRCRIAPRARTCSCWPATRRR